MCVSIICSCVHVYTRLRKAQALRQDSFLQNLPSCTQDSTALRLKVSVAGKHELDQHQEGSSRFWSFLLCLGSSRFPRQLSGKESPAKQEIWAQSLGQEDLLVKEIATHSSILAWETLWREEPGRLQSMGSQRLRHNLMSKQQQESFPTGGEMSQFQSRTGNPRSIKAQS